MDQRKAKKTRSYGDPFHDTRPSKPSATQSKAPGSGRRSSMNERNGSPSLIAQRGRGEVEIDTTRNSSKPVHRDSPVLEDFQSSDGNVGNSQSIDASERSQALRPCRMPRNVSTLLVPTFLSGVHTLYCIQESLTMEWWWCRLKLSSRF